MDEKKQEAQMARTAQIWMAGPMKKEWKVLAKLSPRGILREALKLYAANLKVYVSIQLVLMLPLAILLSVAEYFAFVQYMPSLPSAARTHFLRAAQSFDGGNLDLKSQAELVLVSIAASILFRTAIGLSLSTTLYSVGLHYAGRPVSFVDAVRASTPRLWERLALTTLYVNALTYSITLLQTVGSLLLQCVTSSEFLLSGYSALATVVALIAGFCIAIILMISSSVSVLEEEYGWEAVKKGLKLLRWKEDVATLLEMLWTVPVIIDIYFGPVFTFQLSRVDFSDFSPLDVALLSFTEVLYLAGTIFYWQIRTLCAGVQYVSCKAYHGESLSESLYEKRTIQPVVEGSERFREDESKAALLEGAQLKGSEV